MHNITPQTAPVYICWIASDNIFSVQFLTAYLWLGIARWCCKNPFIALSGILWPVRMPYGSCLMSLS